MLTLWYVPVLLVVTHPFSAFVASRPTFCRHTAVSVDAEEVESSCQKGKISTAGHNLILRSNCHLSINDVLNDWFGTIPLLSTVLKLDSSEGLLFQSSFGCT